MGLNKYSGLILLIFSSLNLIGGDITGTIKVGNTQQPVAGAHIYIAETNSFSISNTNGYFKISGVKAGEHTLSVSMAGFKHFIKQIKITNENLELNIPLNEELENLPELIVESQMLGGSIAKAAKSGGSVSFISPKQMQQLSFTDVNNALRNISGVYLQEEDGFGLRPNIGLRGSGLDRSSKITIMEDGVLMAPAPYSAPAAYYFPTIGRMSSIEVLKGSSQITQGPQTTGGAINLVSTAIPTTTQARIHLIGGSFNSKNLHAFYGKRYKHVAFMVEAFNQSSVGFKELPNNASTGFNKNDYVAKIQLNTGTNAKIYQSIIFKAGITEENSNETYLGLTNPDFKENPFQRYAASALDNMLASQQQLSATYFAQISRNIEITTTIYRNQFERNWYKFQSIKDSLGNKLSIGEVFENDGFYLDVLSGNENSNWGAIDLRANQRAYFSEGVQTRIKVNKTLGNSKHSFTTGGRIHRDGMDRFQQEDTYDLINNQLALITSGLAGSQSNLLLSAEAASIFSEYVFETGIIKVTPGFRYENINYQKKNFGKNDPDRTGFEQSIANTNTSVFIPGISAFFSLTEVSGIFTGVYKGFSPQGVGSDAAPETSINYEVGYRQNNTFGRLQTAIFMGDYSNLLGSDLAATGGSGGVEQFNAGESIVFGMETEYAHQLFLSEKLFIPVAFNYTFTQANFQNAFNSAFEPWSIVNIGDEIPYLPKHMLNFSTGLTHQYFSILLQYHYNGEVRTTAGIGSPSEDEKIPSFQTFNLTSEVNVSSSTNIFFNIQNIFNQEYAVSRRPIGLRPGMPRNIRIGVKWNFRNS